MSGSDRGDRGALVALTIIVIAVVFVFLFDRLGEPTNQAVGQPASDYIKAGQNGDVPQSEAKSNNFNPWLDSYAQWGMAVLSIAATFVSIWAVRLLRKTLAETQQATKAAQASADAAAETNKTTRDIGEAQVRAYLTCTGGEYDIEDNWVFVRPFLANKGQSPAKNIKINAHLAINNFRIGDDGKIQIVSTKTKAFEGRCPAIASQTTENGALVYSRVDLGKEGFEILRAGTMAFDVHGQVVWLDVFDREQLIFFSLTSKLEDISELGISKRRTGTFEVYNKGSENG